MKMTFPTEFDIGDKVKILAGEHNDKWRSRMAIGLFYNVHVVENISKEREHNYNWDGRIGRITEIGIDLCQVVYIVEFRSEPFKPCFKGEELELVSRKSQAKPLKEIIIDAKYEIGDKVKVLPRARSLRATIEIDGKVCSEFMDNHMPLEELNHYYENKIGWFSKKENEHEWFNNRVIYLNSSEDRPEIWQGKVGEIVNVEVDGTEENHTVIYGVKYSNEAVVPYFREQDLRLVSALNLLKMPQTN